MSSAAHPVFAQLVEATTQRYRSAGRFARKFVRGKLRHDPVFYALLSQGLLPSEGVLLDLGCGRGILMSLVAVAREWAASHDWPAEWAKPPGAFEAHGVELRPAMAEAARLALGNAARITVGDLDTFDPPPCRAVVLLDVLQYLDHPAQDRLLDRISRALERPGVLIVREADAGGGWRFQATRLAERSCAVARGAWRQAYHYRRKDEWVKRIESLGFRTTVQPMSEGTPFANVLLVARRD